MFHVNFSNLHLIVKTKYMMSLNNGLIHLILIIKIFLSHFYLRILNIYEIRHKFYNYLHYMNILTIKY